jgi:hypothetical protein
VSYETLRTWQRSFPAFSVLIQKATAKGVAVRLSRIEAAGKAGDWRADGWVLAHAHPEHFSTSRVQLEVSGSLDVDADVTPAQLPLDLDRAREIYRDTILTEALEKLRSGGLLDLGDCDRAKMILSRDGIP